MDAQRFQMIAIDLDGTLLGADGHVSPATRAAVRRAVDAGVVVCFATGRNLTESLSILDEADHHEIGVFVGGAMVVDPRRRLTLQRTLMEPALARDLCRAFEQAGHAAMALQDTAEAGVDYLISDGLPLDAGTQRWIDVTSATVRRERWLGERAHEHTVRVGIVAGVEACRRVRGDLERQFGASIYCHSIHVPATGVDVLEVFDPSVNKWQGLQHVAARRGVDPQAIIAVGDDVNDLHMIRGAGLGVAMGNARPALRNEADLVIGPNTRDGLAEFIDRWLDQRQGHAKGGPDARR